MPRLSLPDHLPRKLTIAFWAWFWATDRQSGEGFCDLDGAFRALVARGFNTARVDALWSWAYDLDGRPRGPLEVGRAADPGWCDHCPGLTTHGGGRVDALEGLLELCELARRDDVFLALTSWEFQEGHSVGLVADPAVRREILGVPVAERPDYLARQCDRALRAIKAHGLADRIAYVELHNEIENIAPGGFPGGRPGLRAAVGKALAFLRTQHPDLLFTDDHQVDTAEHGFDYAVARRSLDKFAANAQLLDHHLYAWSCSLQFDLIRRVMTHPIPVALQDEVVPRQLRENKLLRWLIRSDALPWEEHCRHWGCDWFAVWRPLMYLYQYLDVDRYDYWMFRHYPEFEERMRAFWRGHVSLFGEEAARRGVPAVCDEGYVMWPPTHSAFEPSAVGRANFDFIVDHMLEAGYWGIMVSTYAFPGQPLWEHQADWLRGIHRRIIESP